MRVNFAKEPKELSYTIETSESNHGIPLSITAIPRYEPQSFSILENDICLIEIGSGMDHKQFFSLDIIHINNSLANKDSTLTVPQKTNSYYRFYISEIKPNEKIVRLDYNDDIVKIVFSDAKTSYLNVTDNLFMGIDSDDNLTSVIINNVNTESIFNFKEMQSTKFFREKTRLPKFILGLFLFQFFLVVFLSDWKNNEIVYFTLFNILICILIFISPFSVYIDKSTVSYSFLFINKKISWNEIESIEIKDKIMDDFPLGFGIKYSKKLGWAYVFGSKTGLYINLKNGKKRVLNVNNNIELLNFLNDNIPQFSFKTAQ